MVVRVAVVVAWWSWITQAVRPSWDHSNRTGPRVAAARAASRRTSSSTRPGSGPGAARASMKSSPSPGTPSTSRPPPASGSAAPDHWAATPSWASTATRFSPDGSSAASRANGSRQPRWVGNRPGTGSPGQVRSHRSPLPVGRPKQNGATRRPTTVVAGTGRPSRSATRRPNALSPSRRLNRLGQLSRAARATGSTRSRSQRMVWAWRAPAARGWMDAELDPLAGVAVELGGEAVDGAEHGHGVVVAEGGRAWRLDRPGGVAGGELDHPALRDPRDAAVVDVDGLVGDGVQPGRGPGAQDGQDVVAAGQAVAERSPLGRAGPEAPDVDRAAGGQRQQGPDGVAGAGEPVTGRMPAQARVPLRQVTARAEADELGHVGLGGQAAQQLVLERHHGASIEARRDRQQEGTWSWPSCRAGSRRCTGPGTGSEGWTGPSGGGSRRSARSPRRSGAATRPSWSTSSGTPWPGWPAWPTSSGSTWPRRSAATPATARAAAPPRAPARWPS